MVEVRSLVKHFRARRQGMFAAPAIVRAVDGISFSIPKGETLGLVGESGSGKTTAARSVLRLIEPDSGEIEIRGTRVDLLPHSELRTFRQHTAIVFQDPYSSLNPRMTAGKIIAEPLFIHTSMKRTEREDRVKELLDLVGLSPDQADRYPHQLSGGQRQRIGIARALALNPSFIVLDEPVSALDVSIQGQILNLLRDLQKKFSLTYMFVAHDLAVVEHLSTRVAVMYLGRIVEYASRDALYGSTLHPYTQSLLSSIPRIKPEKRGFSVLRGEIPSPEDPPSGCHFHPRCPHAMDICRQEYPAFRTRGETQVACHLF